MSYFSCSKRRNDDAAPEKFRQSSVLPHIAMGTDPAIALESVANAHTAADLHVRPVSKTALVSRSWAPRVIKEIHDASGLAIHKIGARVTSLRSGCDAVLRVKKATF
ncbi:hypothetical protein ACQR10_01420 [Bradyrhizobium sp. HKCCYLRH2060]|uniref:hypothetical protein n=1 Tax=Bradyrhizobium sp. HKCCYLRH2060 TaxID=3420743 RepID=UPI003EB86FC1